MLDLDLKREPVAPKQAATLLVVRDASGDTSDNAAASANGSRIEVFCVRRHAKSAFLGGAVVFPGGKLDAADREAAAAQLCDGLDGRAESFADDREHALALAICACRESLEEAALLPTVQTVEHDVVARLRVQLEAGEAFATVLRSHTLRLATAALKPFARWITPEAEARRFDARFFLTRLPPGQRGKHDDHETTSSVWATPQRLLAAFASGDLFLAPPTLRALELLAPMADVTAAEQLCDEQSLLPICPRVVAGNPTFLALPGDPEHPITESRVAGPTRFVLREHGFVSENPSR